MSDPHVLTTDHCIDWTSAQGFLPPPSPGSSGDGGSACVLFELHGMPYFYLVGGSSGVQRVPVSLVETRASCRVSCELSVLLGLLNGTLKPLAAVASGKLRVTGERTAFRAIGNTQATLPCAPGLDGFCMVWCRGGPCCCSKPLPLLLLAPFRLLPLWCSSRLLPSGVVSQARRCVVLRSNSAPRTPMPSEDA